MSININFSIQGNYANGNELLNILLNENVKTSSIITYNLLELIKNKYSGTKDYTVDLNISQENLNTIFYSSIKNYIHELPSVKCSYGNSYQHLQWFSTQHALDYGISFNDNSTLNFNIKEMQKDASNTEVLKLLSFDEMISSQWMRSGFGLLDLQLSHKTKTSLVNSPVGATSAMNYNGYNAYIRLPRINCDKYGHIKESKDYVYTPPSTADCCKVLEQGSSIITGDPDTTSAWIHEYSSDLLDSDYHLSDFTTLAININIGDYLYTLMVDSLILKQLEENENIFIPFMDSYSGLTIKLKKVLIPGFTPSVYDLQYRIYFDSGRKWRSETCYLKSVIGYVYAQNVEQE